MKLHSWLTTIIVTLLIQVVGYLAFGDIFDLGWGGLVTIPLSLSCGSALFAISDGVDDEGQEQRWKAWLHWYPTSLPTDPRFAAINQHAKANFLCGAIYAGVSLAVAVVASLVVEFGSEVEYVLLATTTIGVLLFIDLKYVYGPRR
jgi:hypothetical protein